MFGLKKKRDPVDVVDLTLLQKKGLLKPIPDSISSTSSIYPTLTADNNLSQPSETTQSDGMDFLSSFAAAATATSSTTNTAEPQSNFQQTSDNENITTLKVNVDRISDRIMDLAEKLQILERKFEILENERKV